MTQANPAKPVPRAAAPAAPAYTWAFLGRVLLKAVLLFAALNLVFAALYPLSTGGFPLSTGGFPLSTGGFPMRLLGQASLYNLLMPGRQRLPFGENPAQSYNLSLYNLDAMFASLALNAAPKAAGEYRLLVVGDSSVWGTLLRPNETLAGQLNALNLICGGKPVRAYNLGYPTISVTKDLMVLQEAARYQPDQVLWLTTLEGMLRKEQLRSPILANNPERARALIAQYGLNLDPADPAFVAPSFWDRTLVGARRPLADLLRLQLYGFMWGATGVDQVYAWNPQKDAAQRDFGTDVTFHGLSGPGLDANLLALDVLQAGVRAASPAGLMVVNEPILISSGKNSDLRYDYFYPRWAYDSYRGALAGAIQASGAQYLDLWNIVPEAEFTNSAIHLTPAGEALLAQAVAGQLCVQK